MQDTLPKPEKRFRWLTGHSGAILSGILTASSCAILVKLTGFGKDLVVASEFGTSEALDAFAMGYLLPALTANIFSGVHDALIPAHAESVESGQEMAAAEMAASGFTLYSFILAGVLLVMGLLSTSIVARMAGGFNLQKQELTVHILRQSLPFAWCLGVSHYLAAMLNCHRRFLAAALAPAFIPLCSAVALLAVPQAGIETLLHSTQIGGVLLVVSLIWAIRRKSNQPLLRFNWGEPSVKRLTRDCAPLLAGPLITSGLPVVDNIMAGHLSCGDVSVLGYSEKICSIFFAVMATAVGTALYPYLAELSAQRKWDKLLSSLHRYTLIIVGISLPIVAALWLLAPWIVGLLFERGAFQASDVARVSQVLRCHSIQIPFYIMAVLASQVVMAMRSGKFMLLTTLVNLTLNVLLNLLLVRSLGLPGIPLATAGVYLVSATMLYLYIRRSIAKHDPPMPPENLAHCSAPL